MCPSFQILYRMNLFNSWNQNKLSPLWVCLFSKIISVMSLGWDIGKRTQISSNVIRSELSLSVLQLDAKNEFLVFEVSMATSLVSLK